MGLSRANAMVIRPQPHLLQNWSEDEIIHHKSCKSWSVESEDLELWKCGDHVRMV